jgi:hypothetical protein
MPTAMPPSAFMQSSRYPDAGEYLRGQLNLPSTATVNLWCLPDPPGGGKPSIPLPMLIKLAIYGSPKKRLTLQEIYGELAQRFTWFRENQHDQAWKVRPAPMFFVFLLTHVTSGRILYAITCL